MLIARVWTGFNGRTSDRGNIENTILFDLLAMNAKEHDSFPKQGLDGFHIGDEFPLCQSLPKLAFLKKGAKYRFLGSSNNPVMNDKSSNLDLALGSALYNELCNKGSDGKCRFKSVVYLKSDLTCFGDECSLDIIRTVKVILSAVEFVYFEYVQAPCVEFEFPEFPAVSTSFGSAESICVDRRSILAAPACCLASSFAATVQSKYNGEIMSFDSAQKRCSAIGTNQCSFTSITSSRTVNRVWTSDSCRVFAQVFEDGRVSVVHNFTKTYNSPSLPALQLDSNIKFGVNWVGNSFPTALSNCGGVCQIRAGSCLCPTTVTTSVVFTDSLKIPSQADVLRELKVGAVDPTTISTYSVFASAPCLIVYVDSTRQFNANTVFRVETDGSRIRFFANIRSEVLIGSTFRFRNPPNFMQHDELNRRDAEYEVDAVLKHLLYHQNTAPFVADLMIKRFVSSNPSPAYIEAVADAFYQRLL
jgi:hypothetical protein